MRNSKIPTPDLSKKENVEFEILRTLNDIKFNFGKDDYTSKHIVYKCVCNLLKQMQIDSDNLTFVEFFGKYIHNMECFSYLDFTSSQLKYIIEESVLNEEDKNIAYKLFVEQKTYSEVADECNIGDERTIGNNKDRISTMLKSTAIKLFKNK